MKTTKIVDVSGVGQSYYPTVGAFNPTAKFNEDGIAQIEITGSGSSTVRIEGRLSPEAPWVSLSLSGATTVSASGYHIIPLFPEMRVEVISTVPTTFKVWIVD